MTVREIGWLVEWLHSTDGSYGIYVSTNIHESTCRLHNDLYDSVSLIQVHYLNTPLHYDLMGLGGFPCPPLLSAHAKDQALHWMTANDMIQFIS